MKRAVTTQALEHDRGSRPLSLFEPALAAIRDRLQRPGERLPLILESAQDGTFRVSVALWVQPDGSTASVESLTDLRGRVAAWDGVYPEPAIWQRAKQQARQLAGSHLCELKERALRRQTGAQQRQVQAARARLKRELGRYLVAVDGHASDLSALLHTQITRDIASAARLQKCLERLGGYPQWNTELRAELNQFARALTDNERKGRLLGRELDAALHDPRWQAATPARAQR